MPVQSPVTREELEALQGRVARIEERVEIVAQRCGLSDLTPLRLLNDPFAEPIVNSSCGSK